MPHRGRRTSGRCRGGERLLVLRGLRLCELRLQSGDLQPAGVAQVGVGETPESACLGIGVGMADLGLPLVQALVGLESGLATNVHKDSRLGTFPLRVHSHLGCLPT